MTADDLESALLPICEILKKGGVIAYPTEAVYGLGCDPYNQEAVLRLLQIKQRTPDKGLIVIGHCWEQLQPLTKTIATAQLEKVLASWPGPVTWLFPADPKVPTWIRGNHASVAIRVTGHPIAAKLCQLFGGPLVSTSANIAEHPPIRDSSSLIATFKTKIDAIVPGALGDQQRPSQIRDALTGEIFRA